jgi:hypothetical protein
MLARTHARLRLGDIGPLMRFYAKDVQFHFPGEHSWSANLSDKRALEAWLERFASTGLQLYADEILISGPPWKTTVVIRGHDHLIDEQGTVVYENRAVIWGSASWGKLKRYEVYEDTQKVAAFDDYLQSRTSRS